MQIDIQAAIKCARKIDQRRMPSDGALRLVLIFDLNKCVAYIVLLLLIVMFYLY